MKNGIKRHMNDPYNIGPHIGQRIVIGPDIEAPGWGQRYSSPYQLPVTRPTWWNGPDKPDFTRGRHKFRTLPRGPGYPSPSVNPNVPEYAHNLGCVSCGMGQEEQKTPILAYLLIGAMAYGLYKAVAEGVKA